MKQWKTNSKWHNQMFWKYAGNEIEKLQSKVKVL